MENPICLRNSAKLPSAVQPVSPRYTDTMHDHFLHMFTSIAVRCLRTTVTEKAVSRSSSMRDYVFCCRQHVKSTLCVFEKYFSSQRTYLSLGCAKFNLKIPARVIYTCLEMSNTMRSVWWQLNTKYFYNQTFNKKSLLDFDYKEVSRSTIKKFVRNLKSDVSI